jgi:hypothetical protein
MVINKGITCSKTTNKWQHATATAATETTTTTTTTVVVVGARIATTVVLSLGDTVRSIVLEKVGLLLLQLLDPLLPQQQLLLIALKKKVKLDGRRP